MNYRVLPLLLIGLLTVPTIRIHAEPIKPDIRNYDVFVDQRPMPVVTCMGKTPEEWISQHIGYNQLQGNDMKFSDDLFTDGDQVEGITERLTPYTAKQAMNKTMDEQGNKPSWVGSICYYRGSGNGQIISSELITAEAPITTAFKKIRYGNIPLSAYIARGHLQLTGNTYDTQNDPLEPDPQKQSKCDVTPPGVNQAARVDKGTGMNVFSSFFEQLQLAAACQICACEDTKMYIKTDSTIQYDTDPLCRSTGCDQTQVNTVDPKSRATQESQDSGGWINAQARPGLLQVIHQLVTTLFGSITGKVDAQQTKNKVNAPTAPSSYYTTKSLEVGMDFLNCKLFPYAKREQMPECKTSWIKALVGSVANQLQNP